MEQLLELVFELIGLLLAQVFEPGAVMAQFGLGHCLLEHLVVEPVELKREEQELRGDGGDLLLDVAEEFLPLGVSGVGGVEQARIGDDATHQIVESLELAHGLGKPRTPLAVIGECGELAGIALLHGGGGALGGRKINLELRRVRPLIEVGEVPLRQLSELRLGPRLCNAAAFRFTFGCRRRGVSRVLGTCGQFGQHLLLGSSLAGEWHLVWEGRRAPARAKRKVFRPIWKGAEPHPHQNRTEIKRIFTLPLHNFGTGAAGFGRA